MLDVLATGTHLFVDAPAGADVTGTLAAVVADAAATGRTVLYVPGHRRAATALAARLGALGLGDLLLDVAPDAGWRTATARRLLGAMTLEAPAVDANGVGALRRELVAHARAPPGVRRRAARRARPVGRLGVRRAAGARPADLHAAGPADDRAAVAGRRPGARRGAPRRARDRPRARG